MMRRSGSVEGGSAGTAFAVRIAPMSGMSVRRMVNSAARPTTCSAALSTAATPCSCLPDEVVASSMRNSRQRVLLRPDPSGDRSARSRYDQSAVSGRALMTSPHLGASFTVAILWRCGPRRYCAGHRVRARGANIEHQESISRNMYSLVSDATHVGGPRSRDARRGDCRTIRSNCHLIVRQSPTAVVSAWTCSARARTTEARPPLPAACADVGSCRPAAP